MASWYQKDEDDQLVTSVVRKLFHIPRGHIRRFEEERFFEKIETVDDCWIYRGGTANKGYGQFVTDDRRTVKAHRWSWEKFRGEVPEGLVLDHLCRNRACVNPDHLEPVTVAVNNARGEGLCVVNAAKTECQRGHPLAGDNLYRYADGRRECRTCSRAYKRAWRERNHGKS